MTFGNPAAVWGLLALLAVVAIHTLQRRRRTRVVSGLFLLDADPPPVRGGRWIERLRASRSLWLELAAAALLVWLLADPRFPREEASQRVVVVLDSTASMSAWRDAAALTLRRRLPDVEAGLAHTHWVLLESHPDRPSLYAGTSREALEQALEGWDPSLGGHDPGPVLDGARQMAGRDGRVLLVTDHELAVPPGVERLAVGEPLDNVGFAGLGTGDEGAEPRWQALVKSYSRRPERRRLFVESDAGRRELDAVELAPGEVRALRGGFPPGSDSLMLILEADRFALDDRLPMVRPATKPLAIALDRRASEDPMVQRLLASLEAVTLAGSEEPAALAIGFDESAARAAAHAVLFVPAPGAEARGAVVADPHPLVDGPSWHGLIPGRDAGLARGERDRVLVWYGRRPLVALRTGDDGARQLRLGFLPEESNAGRQAALPLLLHRFAEEARAAAVGFERRNVETHQLVDVAFDPAATPPERVAAGTDDDSPSGTFRAPGVPGIFHVRQDGAPLLTAAAHFADAREADLTQATAFDETGRPRPARLRAATRPDPMAPLWLLLAGALMAADWSLPRTGR